MGKPKQLKTRVKVRKLSDLELTQLAEEMKKQECIWDLSNDNHKKVDAVDAAWSLIATATNFTGTL